MNPEIALLCIAIETPLPVVCQGTWSIGKKGVIFVREKDHLQPLYRLLTAQNRAWFKYSNLIRVAPTIVKSMYELHSYCGKQSTVPPIDVEKLRADAAALGISFLLYQYDAEDEDGIWDDWA